VLNGVQNTAPRFVQMAAVVKLAFAGVRCDIGHELRQLHGRDVVQTKLLKTGRINQRGGFAASIQYNVVLVVVCLPELSALEISCVSTWLVAPSG